MGGLDSYVRNAWYVAAWAHDLHEAKPHPMTILGERIALWRKADGVACALEDRCVHRLAPLSLGRCEGDNLRCMYHGLLFDPDGAVVEIPGQDLIPPRARIKAYPAVERHSWIWVWMGEPSLANPDLIPEAKGFDHPDYVLGHGQLDYAAEARLIHDNLLDFAHLTYVHANSFEAGEAWATTRPKVTSIGRGVRVERWLRDQKAMSALGDGLVDVWNGYEFHVPGILLLPSVAYPAGTADRYPDGPPADLQLPGEHGVTMSSQAVTPMMEKTSRYFFSWGPRRDCGDEGLRDILMQIAGVAFNEDKVMIEAQQKVIDSTSDPRVMVTSSDVAVMQYQRLVKELVSAEPRPAHDAA